MAGRWEIPELAMEVCSCPKFTGLSSVYHGFYESKLMLARGKPDKIFHNFCWAGGVGWAMNVHVHLLTIFMLR